MDKCPWTVNDEFIYIPSKEEFIHDKNVINNITCCDKTIKQCLSKRLHFTLYHIAQVKGDLYDYVLPQQNKIDEMCPKSRKINKHKHKKMKNEIKQEIILKANFFKKTSIRLLQAVKVTKNKTFKRDNSFFEMKPCNVGRGLKHEQWLILIDCILKNDLNINQAENNENFSFDFNEIKKYHNTNFFNEKISS